MQYAGTDFFAVIVVREHPRLWREAYTSLVVLHTDDLHTQIPAVGHLFGELPRSLYGITMLKSV